MQLLETTTDEKDLTDSFFLVGAPLARLVQLRQLHPLEDTQNPLNPFNLLLILRTLTICNSVKSVGENAHPNIW